MHFNAINHVRGPVYVHSLLISTVLFYKCFAQWRSEKFKRGGAIIFVFF